MDELRLLVLRSNKMGLEIENGYLVLIKTDIDSAPEFLLNFIGCKCNTTAKNHSRTTHCSCSKHGLKCVAAYSHSRGELRNNMIPKDYIIDDDEQIDGNLFDLFC